MLFLRHAVALAKAGFAAPNFVAHFFGNDDDLRAALVIAYDVKDTGQ